ncbi:hypothetical protein [Mesorhizobium sp. M7A.F.Ca.CA.002.12.1.1]|uniref:hypothetical protein n=1 Tax=Mesorhizobium sp. M7A.F.Ca.CA.002.12.1.1 TaxID=2496735 RepID=UPI000FC9C832|nr:hypothetical protein [Mesorhizobium sp. M7A.F.Ca.CA.002.12.1.1]RUX60137.1 hypothetical protein EN989_10990 [Mesorhizobium sp. M7A.F.Ca.CA.002.12.1.1]
MKELHEMTASELIHRMLTTFNKNQVSRDRDGDPDEFDTIYTQDTDYCEAAEQLDTLLQGTGK